MTYDLGVVHYLFLGIVQSVSNSESQVLLISQSYCDSKLDNIGGKVRLESGSPLSSRVLALKIILMYLFTNLTAEVLKGHNMVFTLSSKLKAEKLGTTRSIIAKRHLCWAPEEMHLIINIAWRGRTVCYRAVLTGPEVQGSGGNCPPA